MPENLRNMLENLMSFIFECFGPAAAVISGDFGCECEWCMMAMCVWKWCYIYIYRIIYLHMFKCMCFRVYLCVYMCMYVCVLMCVYTRVYVCVYVCVYRQVMDRRVKASREEQLQKHAAALQAAMAAAGHASSAQDAGAMALQAAMAAASSVPKEGTQLKEMLKSQSSHNTLAHVLTHLWHTERLWRHALHQGLQLFQETHQVPILLDWCAVGWCESASRARAQTLFSTHESLVMALLHHAHNFLVYTNRQIPLKMLHPRNPPNQKNSNFSAHIQIRAKSLLDFVP